MLSESENEVQATITKCYEGEPVDIPETVTLTDSETGDSKTYNITELGLDGCYNSSSMGTVQKPDSTLTVPSTLRTIHGNLFNWTPTKDRNIGYGNENYVNIRYSTWNISVPDTQAVLANLPACITEHYDSDGAYYAGKCLVRVDPAHEGDFTVKDGSLTITPLQGVTVTIVGANNTTDYDGNNHSVSGYTVTPSSTLYTEADINFSGNVEARDVIYGDTDIVVMDGFSGNVYLKASEGMASAVMGLFKNKLTEGIKAKFGALLAYSKIKDIKNTFDYSDAGGAPILGLKGAVLKVHGNSRSVEFYYAIHRAVDYVNSDITGKIKETIEKTQTVNTETEESGADE